MVVVFPPKTGWLFPLNRITLVSHLYHARINSYHARCDGQSASNARLCLMRLCPVCIAYRHHPIRCQVAQILPALKSLLYRERIGSVSYTYQAAPTSRRKWHIYVRVSNQHIYI